MLDADGLLPQPLLEAAETTPLEFDHPPVVIRNRNAPLATGLFRLHMSPDSDYHLVDHYIVFFSDEHRRIMTGADILGRLLRGVVPRKS